MRNHVRSLGGAEQVEGIAVLGFLDPADEHGLSPEYAGGTDAALLVATMAQRIVGTGDGLSCEIGETGLVDRTYHLPLGLIEERKPERDLVLSNDGSEARHSNRRNSG